MGFTANPSNPEPFLVQGQGYSIGALPPMLNIYFPLQCLA